MPTPASLEEQIEQMNLEGVYWPLPSKIFTQEQKRHPKVVVLAGPTGCGKTALSLLLAQAMNGEIVSADSMQLYCGMDIGTAKPTLEERHKVAHHLIDIRQVTDPFSVVDYYYEAQRAIEQIEKRGKVPIIVGGAGFYLHVLLYGPPAGPPSVPQVRRQIEQEFDKEGAEEMYRRLLEKDLDYAMTITMHDRHKIVRALEIMTLTGVRVSSLCWKTRSRIPQIEGQCWFLYRPRPILYQRVEERCDKMISEGLLLEVERLDKMGLRANPSASQAIGYRQALLYLDSPRSEKDYQNFVENFKRGSRHYVKRQLTWFRREALFAWLNAELYDIETLVDLISSSFRGQGQE